MFYTISIKKNGEFKKLYASKTNYVSPYFVIYCRKNRFGLNRVGFTVSTKLGNAVTRNRIRRRLREIYRMNEQKLKRSFDFVIIARSRAENAPFDNMNECFQKAIRTLNVAVMQNE